MRLATDGTKQNAPLFYLALSLLFRLPLQRSLRPMHLHQAKHP